MGPDLARVFADITPDEMSQFIATLQKLGKSLDTARE